MLHHAAATVNRPVSWPKFPYCSTPAACTASFARALNSSKGRFSSQRDKKGRCFDKLSTKGCGWRG
jgi:hypothetical protein